MPNDDSFFQKDQSNYNVRNAEIERVLRAIADRIKLMIPTGWGFSLQIFTYGENGSLFYISSADRQDMLKVMQEFIDRNKQ